jgi:hypothetical protein
VGSLTSLVRARAGVARGSGRVTTVPGRHHVVVGRIQTTDRWTSVLVGARRGGGSGPRRRESRVAGTADVTPAGSRGVAIRRLAGVTGAGASRRRTVREAGAGVASRRRVVVSRALRAAGRVTIVVRAVGTPVAMRGERAVVTRQGASHAVARRRAIADGLPLTLAGGRWLRGGLGFPEGRAMAEVLLTPWTGVVGPLR